MFKTGFKPNTELWKKLSTAPLKQNEANNHIYVSSIFSLQQLKQRKKKSGFVCLGLCAMGSRWLQLLLLPLAFQLHPCAQIRCSRLCITDKTCMVFMSAKSTCSADASHESALKKKEEQGNGEGG